MRRMLVAVAAVCLLLGADDPKDSAKKHLDAMQGEWTLVTTERNGGTLPEEIGRPVRRIITGNKFTALRGDETVAEGTLTLDASKRLKAIDAKGESGSETIKGIYELEGDTLRVCYGPPDSERPTVFTAK